MISIISSVYNCSEDIPFFVRNSVDLTASCELHYVVNDGSQDSTDNMVNSHTKGCTHLRYENLNENRGLFPRKRELSEQVAGRYVVGLSHDDYLSPGYLESVNEVLEKHPDVGLISCNRAIVDEFGNYKAIDRPDVNVGGRVLGPEEYLDYVILQNWPYHSFDGGAVMNVEIANKVYSDFVVDKLGAHADVFFMWMIALTSSAYHVNEVGHVTKQHPATWSQNSEVIQTGMLAMPIVECIQHYRDIGVLNARYARKLIKRYVPLLKSDSGGRVY